MIIDPKTQNFSENHKLMTGSILPRPIAFVSTRSLKGVLNLAPFSYFNGVCSKPPTIVFVDVDLVHPKQRPTFVDVDLVHPN